jgi:CTP:molybdopterin cytidylyltransferase MocA
VADRVPADRAGRVAGVVLAAGMSSRLGTNKLLLWLDSEPLVRRSARLAVEAGLSPVVVVLGHEAERVAAALDGLPVVTVVNPAHREGMHRSLQHGIRHVPADCAAAVVLLADMPFVTLPMLRRWSRASGGAEPLVLSLYGEVQAPPTLYARALFPSARGGRGVRPADRPRAPERGGGAAWPRRLADIDRPKTRRLA